MAAKTGKFETHPLATQPWPVILYWRAFLSGFDPSFPLRVKVAYAAARDMFEALDAWHVHAFAAANVYGKQSLAHVRNDLDKLEVKLQAVANVIAVTEDVSALWAGAAVPLAMQPFPIAHHLVSIRNQLIWGTVPPKVAIATSNGFVVNLESLMQPAGMSDFFGDAIAWSVHQSEPSLPGEAATAYDYAAKAATKAKIALEKVVEIATETASTGFWILAGGVAIYAATR